MQPLRPALKGAVARYATASLTGLAAWRIALGLTCAHAIARRWGMLELFYTDAGVYPVASLGAHAGWDAGPLSYVSTPLVLHLAFALFVAVAVTFAAGLKTRVVKWLLLPVLATVDARTPQLLTGGEVVLHLQALYAAFLPVGATLSADRWLKLRRTPAAPDPARGKTGVQTWLYPLVLLQLALIYCFNTLAKDGVSWRDGTAVARALGAATLVSPFGAWVVTWPPSLLRVFTYGTLAAEGALPFLILSPWARRHTHRVAAGLMVALHGGIFLAMDVGSFSAAMLCYVPLLLHARDEARSVWIPAPRARRFQALAAASLAYLLVARLSIDLILFPRRPSVPLPAFVARITRDLGLLQGWMMFSPEPPAVDFVIVTDAVTRSGRHFDPWRSAIASELVKPFKTLPASVVRAHAFTRYENALSANGRAPLHAHFARWVLAQHYPGSSSAEDQVERFDAFLMVISTRPLDVVPGETLEQRVGLLPLPFAEPLPVAGIQSLGVWTPEHAVDRKILPDGTDVYAPVSATLGAGCPYLTLDLGRERPLRSAYFQAGSKDHFLIEGSNDARMFHPLAEMPPHPGRQHTSRVLKLPGEAVRYVRLRPEHSRAFQGKLSEVAFFDRVVTLPALPQAKDPPGFLASLERPAIQGILSGSNHPDPQCPAEDWRADAKPVRR